MLAIFFGPLVVATWMFYNLDAWQHPERSNYGELMLPIQPLPAFDAQDLNGGAIGLGIFESVWTLVYIGEGECDIYCETSLFSMRQARSMLGNDMPRLQYLYLAVDDQAFETAKLFQKRHPKMTVLRASAPATLGGFGENPQTKMFLIDPHTNRVLRYEKGSSTKGLYSDLHKLLENSRIG